MPWQAVPRYVAVSAAPSTAHQSASGSRWEQLTRLHVPEISLLREPFTENQSRDSNDLQAELELAFHGEVTETVQALATHFEVQNAAWELAGGSASTAVQKHLQHNLPGQSLHQPLLAHPTCASAYTALLHRRAACIRDVLNAQSRHVDTHLMRTESSTKQSSGDVAEDAAETASAGEGQGAQDGQRGSLALEKSQAPLVQQLLCSFIELAASTNGKASIQALRAVSSLLAAQRPLVLVTEFTSWLPQLLGWLGDFLRADGEGEEDDVQRMEVRGIAAGAMLDLGVCSGSLRCILLTVAALLKHSSRSEARNLDCKQVAASVHRLRQCCSVTPSSSPCGGCTVFLPVSQLETPVVPRLHLRGHRSGAGGAGSAGDATASLGGKFVSVASDGRFLYVHSSAGLAKYGSGYRGTVAGHVYACKARYRSTERPWLACVGTMLYLRSPAMAPHSLAVVDCATLEEVGTVYPGGRGGIELNEDGSASALTPEKGSRPSGSGGGGDGGGPSDRPSTAHHGAASRSVPERSDGPYGAVLGSAEMDVVEPSEMEMHGMFIDEPPALRSFYNDIRRQRSHRAAVMSTLEQLSRGATRTATAPALAAGGESERRAVLDTASSSSERSPLITDGKLLHIISKSSDRQQQTAQQQTAAQQQEMRDEDDESSEGGGQIGSTWANVSFSVDTFDPADGMRHVRSVKIRGPVCDSGIHDGEGTLCCDVCGLLMSSSSPGHRCLVCDPEYDLCDQCLMRGAATLGHRPDHQVREMDASPQREAGAEQQHLPAFPGECLECQSFYTDGRFLMVIIPPHLFGSKIAGYLCRVFCMIEGHHLYDISMGDSQDDPRKDLGKAGMTGSSCYDPSSDIVWNVDVDGARVRRWRHPWTTPLSSVSGGAEEMQEDSLEVSSSDPGSSPIDNALKAILSCLHDAAEKHARCVLEPCHDSLQSWVPFCVESVPSTFAVVATIVKMCIGEDGNGRWLQEEQMSEARSGPDRTQCLHILRTCMRLLVVNVAQLPPQTKNDPEMLENSLHYLRTSIMNLAELSCGPETDKLLLSTCEEAGNAVVAGFDVFFPDTEQQAALLIDLLGRAEHSRILKAIATQMSKPGAHNLLFAIFDGTWLAGGEGRVEMAHTLLRLLFEKVVASPQTQKDEEMADLGLEDGISVTISHSTLLHLLAAFQRNLFSVPLSAQRSTQESEDLLFFYARSLIDHAIRAVEAIMDEEGDVTLSSPFVRVLMPPFCSVLADNAWSQNLNSDIGKELLPSLQGLLRTIEKFNCSKESVKHQDRAFSLKSTESRFLAGKTVSIPRARHSRPVVVKMPGAASMIVRISEDVVLSRKETLRIHKDRESASSSSSTIKGSHRGKRLWRSFKVQGDTVYLTYTRTGHSHDELKVSKHIRCSVFGCAKNSSLLIPLDWLLDLELTLGSLTARFMWSSLREVPKPIDAETKPWLSSPILCDGLRMEWLEAERGESWSEGKGTRQAEQGGQGMDLDSDEGMRMLAKLLASSEDSSSPFSKMLSAHFRSQISCPEWVDHELLLRLATHVAVALINVVGLVPAVTASENAKSVAELPEPLRVVLTSTVRLVQALVMRTRKKLQEFVLERSDSAEDEESVARSGEGSQPAFQAVTDVEVAALKEQAGEFCSALATGMLDRSMLLIASRIGESSSVEACLARAYEALTLEKQDKCNAKYANAPRDGVSSAFGFGVDLACRFLTSDVAASSVWAAAKASIRIVEQRKRVLREMLSMLRTVSFSSVRQIMISTFTSGPFPAELQRCSTKFHIGSSLFSCRKVMVEEVRTELANLYEHLSSLLEDGAGPSLDRSDVSMIHLVLSTFYSLQMEVEDLEWLAKSQIVRKLELIMMCRPRDSEVTNAGLNAVDLVDAESLSGLHDAAFHLLTKLTNNVTQLLRSKGGGSLAPADTILQDALTIAEHLITFLDALSSAESHDLHQMKVSVWLFGLACSCDRVSVLIVQRPSMVHALLRWCLSSNAPIVQRVTLQLLARVLTADGVSKHLRQASEKELEELLLSEPCSEGMVDSILSNVGALLSVPADEGAAAAPSPGDGEDLEEGGGSRRSWARPMGTSASETEGKAGEMQWMVMALPTMRGKQLSPSEQKELEQACLRAMNAGPCYKEPDTDMAKQQAKEVADAVASGDKGRVFTGSYEDCQTLCMHWDARTAITVVLRSFNNTKEATPLWRWYSGHSRYSASREQLSFLRALQNSPVFGKVLMRKVSDCLVRVMGHLDEPAVDSPVALADLQSGLAALDLLSGDETDVEIRQGSRVKLPPIGTAGRFARRMGVVVRCDRLAGTVAVLTEEAVMSKSLQALVPTVLPMVLVQPAVVRRLDSKVESKEMEEAREAMGGQFLDNVVRCFIKLQAAQPQSSVPQNMTAKVVNRLKAMSSRALSVLLDSGVLRMPQVLTPGLIPAIVECASQHAAFQNALPLELRSAAITSLLCESKDKAPSSLLAHARSSSQGGGGGGAEGAAGSAPVTSSSLTQSRVQRGMPSMDSFIRTSRALQRQDQRRARELAAANLADITGQPLRLCQLALDRENGNQDRAANWLFEHGEGFLAEHPEFAEVQDGGGDGNNPSVSSSEDPESPLFLLRDVFSYHDEGQGAGIGGEEAVVGASGAGGPGAMDLPASVLDELRSISHPLGDQERVYEERVFGSALLSRSRGGTMPLPQRRSVPDADLRVGASVTLTDADLDVHQSGVGLGQRFTGQTLFVDSVGWGSDNVKVMCYDEATALVFSQILPTSNLEKVNRVPGHHLDVDTSNVDAMGRSLAETDLKLGSLYARSSLRAILAKWPENEPVHESVFGGRKALLQLLQAAAVGHCVLTAEVSQPFSTAKRAEKDDEASPGSLSELLRTALRQLISSEVQDAAPCAVPVGMTLVNPSPERKRERDDAGGVGEGSPGEVGEMVVRDKRRKHGKDVAGGTQPSKSSAASGGDVGLEFNKNEEAPVAPLGHCLVDECLKALKGALSNLSTVEEASDHPYVRSAGSSQAPQRRCLHVEGSALLFVVFDSRCALLAGETIRFYSDAACTDLLACSVQDEMRKVYLPLVLPSPVWMQVGHSTGSGEDGESSWGYRVLGLPVGEVNMAFGIWLLSLLVNRSQAQSLPSLPYLRMPVILEAVLDLLEKSGTMAAPHSMQLHSLASLLIPSVGKLPDGIKILAHHPAFPKLIAETGSRHAWESRLVSGSGIRPIGDLTKFPLSTYVCSVTEVLAARAVALGSVGRPSLHSSDAGDEMQIELGAAAGPEWLSSLDQTMGIAACLYGGRQQELAALVRQGCETFKEDAGVLGEEGEAVALLDGEELSLVAREALLELFQVEPEAAKHVASSLVPPQQPANKGRAFLAQACALVQQDRAKMWQLLASHDFDNWLVRWGPDRDADLVAFVNMLSESEGTAPHKIKAASLSITDYYRRKLTRLGSVPELSLRRRFVLLKLFNHLLDRALPLIDFSRRFSSSIASTICELQHLIFYSTKSAFVNAVLEWTACPSSRNTERHALTVLLHRPGRWARDPKEKAEEHERWRLQMAAEEEPGVKLEELLVAPSDFGSAREMGADATVTARLVLADPPNGSLPLRNADEIKGNVALIERGGGQFVNVVRRAQEAGAIAVVMADSKEGPLFLMSTELGNSGDDVTIPAVLVSLADSMLLMQRQGALLATITADGVLMQTYRQLRYVSSMRLRQRDEMAWRVTFHGEGHQGFNGPYREALSALCQELQSPQLPLLIPCANAACSVADNRDKYVPRPSATSPELLDMFYFLGQLMGVAMRTRNLLSLDFPSMVWKALVGAELEEEDLKATDFSCWNALQFRDEDGQSITPHKFHELFQCSFTTCLTDGTEVSLLPDGDAVPVTYERREEYRAAVVKARLGESAQQLSKMRAGLCSVIPEPLLGLITWEELERRVCGSPDVDVASLRRHTRYRGGLEGSEPHIQMFWEVLEGFSQADRRLFLRFAWGRERLPLESDYTEHSEMKLFPSDRGNGDQVLPEAETCFFIVKLPQYRTKELMEENLMAAITACREINY